MSAYKVPTIADDIRLKYLRGGLWMDKMRKLGGYSQKTTHPYQDSSWAPTNMSLSSQSTNFGWGALQKISHVELPTHVSIRLRGCVKHLLHQSLALEIWVLEKEASPGFSRHTHTHLHPPKLTWTPWEDLVPFTKALLENPC